MRADINDNDNVVVFVVVVVDVVDDRIEGAREMVKRTRWMTSILHLSPAAATRNLILILVTRTRRMTWLNLGDGVKLNSPAH